MKSPIFVWMKSPIFAFPCENQAHSKPVCMMLMTNLVEPTCQLQASVATR